jgi:hypothetical protein
MSPTKLLNPATIALLYLTAGTLWILFSDNWVAGITDDTALLTTLQTYKGWFYVTATAIPLYFLIAIHKRFVLAAAYKLKLTERRYEELFLRNPHPIAVVTNNDSGDYRFQEEKWQWRESRGIVYPLQI